MRVCAFVMMNIALAAAAAAQDVPHQIRFIASDSSGERQWQGQFERLTLDSLQIRVRDVDTLATFARTAVRSVEREHGVGPGQAAAVGCVTVGGFIGLLGFVNSGNSDEPGLDRALTALGAVVGCGLGAVGGLLASAVSERGWEPWPLPDSLSKDGAA